jgi:NTE family protein
MAEQPGLSLALGGGGVKCYAQLGVLKLLEKEHIAVRGIAATSGGAVIAALYGIGYKAMEIRDLVEGANVGWMIKGSWRDRESLYGFDRLHSFLEKIFGELHLEELQIPIAFPAVDLNTRKIVVLDSGPLLDAVLATTAIPGIFPPQRREGRKLIDGGVLAPVPVTFARALAPEYPVAAVILNPPQNRWEEHPFPQLLHSVSWLRLLSWLRFTRALGIYVRASDLTHRLLAELLLEKEKPDVIIRPEVGHFGLFDQVDIDRLIEIGEITTAQKLAEIKGLFSSH